MYVVKCLVVGDTQVGKTSLLLAYTSTVGHLLTPLPKIYSRDDYPCNLLFREKPVDLKVYDTNELLGNIETITQNKTIQIDLVILCFDLTNLKTLKNIQTKWIKILKNCSLDSNIPYLVVGLKDDLLDEYNTSKNKQQKLQNIKTVLLYYSKTFCQNKIFPSDILDIILKYYSQQLTQKDLKLLELNVVNTQEIEQICKQIGAIRYFNCSAWTSKGLKQLFDNVVYQVLKNNDEFKQKRKKSCIVL